MLEPLTMSFLIDRGRPLAVVQSAPTMKSDFHDPS